LELDEKEIVNAKLGLDVKSKKIVDLVQAGIIDSFASIDQSLKNAGSIASNYLRAYILIKKD
jgi:chaperonin GroEL (HSP60 family)